MTMICRAKKEKNKKDFGTPKNLDPPDGSGACIGTAAQVGASSDAPFDSLFKQSSLRSPRDIILVFVT